MDGEVDHVPRHGAEGEDDDEPDDAGKHPVVDRPVRDLVQELVCQWTADAYEDENGGPLLETMRNKLTVSILRRTASRGVSEPERG